MLMLITIPLMTVLVQRELRAVCLELLDLAFQRWLVACGEPLLRAVSLVRQSVRELMRCHAVLRWLGRPEALSYRPELLGLESVLVLVLVLVLVHLLA